MMTNTERFLALVFTILVIAVVVSILITQSGCAATPHLQPTDASVSLGGAFQSVWGHTESADYDVQQGLKFIKDDTGRHFLDAASMEHGAVFKNLTIGMKAYEEVNKKNNEVQTQNTELATELAAEREQWLGDRTHRLIGWIVAIAAGGGIVLLIVHFALGGSLLGALPFTAIFKRLLGKT